MYCRIKLLPPSITPPHITFIWLCYDSGLLYVKFFFLFIFFPFFFVCFFVFCFFLFQMFTSIKHLMNLKITQIKINAWGFDKCIAMPKKVV